MFARLRWGAAAAGAAAAASRLAGCTREPRSNADLWAEQPPRGGNDTAVARAARKYDDSADWMRADKMIFSDGGWTGILDTVGPQTNAVHMYRIWTSVDGQSCVALAQLCDGCDGHRGIVHGGVTALLFDNTLGWANAMSLLAERGRLAALIERARTGLGPSDTLDDDTPNDFGYTAFLHVNYRSPCRRSESDGSVSVELVCSLDRVDGRKRFITGTMHDVESGQLIADSEGMFLLPRSAAAQVRSGG
jgi:acyl-coenzyme A thioesterase PaaI-like protein